MGQVAVAGLRAARALGGARPGRRGRAGARLGPRPGRSAPRSGRGSSPPRWGRASGPRGGGRVLLAGGARRRRGRGAGGALPRLAGAPGDGRREHQGAPSSPRRSGWGSASGSWARTRSRATTAPGGRRRAPASSPARPSTSAHAAAVVAGAALARELWSRIGGVPVELAAEEHDRRASRGPATSPRSSPPRWRRRWPPSRDSRGTIDPERRDALREASGDGESLRGTKCSLRHPRAADLEMARGIAPRHGCSAPSAMRRNHLRRADFTGQNMGVDSRGVDSNLVLPPSRRGTFRRCGLNLPRAPLPAEDNAGPGRSRAALFRPLDDDPFPTRRRGTAPGPLPRRASGEAVMAPHPAAARAAFPRAPPGGCSPPPCWRRERGSSCSPLRRPPPGP
jgi:hypothetical protein